jgi:hypothetical protein
MFSLFQAEKFSPELIPTIEEMVDECLALDLKMIIEVSNVFSLSLTMLLNKRMSLTSFLKVGVLFVAKAWGIYYETLRNRNIWKMNIIRSKLAFHLLSVANTLAYYGVRDDKS